MDRFLRRYTQLNKALDKLGSAMENMLKVRNERRAEGRDVAQEDLDIADLRYFTTALDESVLCIDMLAAAPEKHNAVSPHEFYLSELALEISSNPESAPDEATLSRLWESRADPVQILLRVVRDMIQIVGLITEDLMAVLDIYEERGGLGVEAVFESR